MDKINLLIGTHKNHSSAGIFMYDFDQDEGLSKYMGKTPIDHFSYFTVSPNKEFVYAIRSLDEGRAKIAAYKRDLNHGTYTLLNELDIDGSEPCYVIINKKRTYAIVANDGSGDIILFKINIDGSLYNQMHKIEFYGRGDNNISQQHSHIQCVKFTPNEDFVIITDLGTDSIYIYKIVELENSIYVEPTNYTYKLSVQGSGPRSFVFHPNGKYIYLINALKSLVTFYDYNKKFGTITLSQIIEASQLKPKGYTHIQISPDGLYLYVSSKLEKTKLLVFMIDQKTGVLKQLDPIDIQAKISHFVCSPNGKFMIVASREENIVLIYKRNIKKGVLYPNPESIKCEHPVFLKAL